ncbi:hypothetical protein LMG26858_04761 [Achromobacter anxifer]|uniref:LysM domain-containing protein n=1 Tax=Achromobacter anxifer TaxID=1287737 RepID=A0A6S7EGP5_9BURK|nr:FimV/HubP family polar landmark protein [Achromobacter anxifer]CAB3911522.1 hypothetical protein LMG26858_04761 [Achromobacter anxifer]
MTQRSRQVKHARRLKALQWAIALAIGTSVCSTAMAMRVGHSRVVSVPGAPLQAVVGLQELTPDEIATLKVSVADEASWQRAGLKPPVPLASMVVRIEDGMDATRKNLRVRATQPPTSGAVDLLLDISSSSGQRQVQVSILVPLRGTSADVTPAAVGTPARSAATRSVNVKSGDNLFAIAQRNAVPNASVYQMLVALWRANPEAFIQNNMNLVKAGQKLVIPDAATVRAVDPAEARRIFNEHAEAFAKYRARIGAAAGANPSVVQGQGGASGSVAPPADAGVASASQPQDRVRLSSGESGGASAQAEAQADARTSTERAMADVEGRVNQLQSNVDDLNKAVAQQGASGTGGSSGATGAAGAAGATGPSGAAGSAGGAAGGAGATGAAGATGGAGATGAAGAAGEKGTAGGSGATGATGTAGSAGATGAAGAVGAAGAAGGTGAAGTQGAAGATGASGAAGTPGASGTPGAAGAPGVSGTSGASGTPGTPGAAGTPGTSNATGAAAGTSSTTPAASTSSSDQTAGTPPNKDATSDMPAWLADNLLVIVTAVLALIAFAIAWLLRRAGARRGDDDEETYEFNEPALDTAALNRKLGSINLDLDEPPTDEPRRVSGPRV